MKRLFLILLLLITSPVLLRMLKVEAQSDFSTENPPDVWSVKIVEGFTTKGGYPVYSGSVIKGRIENVKDPKRLKKEC